MVLADDWGYGDISCLNPASKIPTPCTDALARESMTFTDMHSNSAVCSPTRYGVLTGRYCWRGALKRGVLGGFDDLLIESGRTTVASMLRDVGYRTACIGKWHLGLGWVHAKAPPRNEAGFLPWDDANISIRFDQPLTAGPHTVGFDESLIIPASLDIAPYVYIENGRVIDHPIGRVEASKFPQFWREGSCGWGVQHETSLLEFTRRAEQFITDSARQSPDRPFFLYFPTPSPHAPHVPRKPFRGRSACGVYGDYVVEHDWSVGRVLAALDRNGLTDNTLVIVTSDNGAHMRGSAFDYERDYGHRSNHIYRGQKSDCWDGGHRVPFFARWPGVIKPGTTCDQTSCLTDLLATAAEATGTRLPSDAAEDSVSLLPLWRRDGQASATGTVRNREAVVHHGIDGRFAIRQGRWKLLDCAGSGGWSLPEDSVPPGAPRAQLYDIQADPAEQHNLFDQRPEVVDQLLALLHRYQTQDRSVETA